MANTCLSLTSQPEVIQLKLAGVFSGMAGHSDERLQSYRERYLKLANATETTVEIQVDSFLPEEKKVFYQGNKVIFFPSVILCTT